MIRSALTDPYCVIVKVSKMYVWLFRRDIIMKGDLLSAIFNKHPAGIGPPHID
jgi:hypothetical protein